MRIQLLKSEIVEHGDTGVTLAEALGMSATTLSYKMNDKTEFKLGEMLKIKDRYHLSEERFNEIFFTN